MALASSQKLVELLIKDLTYELALVNSDEVIVSAKPIDDQKQRLELVFSKLMNVETAKCIFRGKGFRRISSFQTKKSLGKSRKVGSSQQEKSSI